jgi:PAS domain S-box-containing protein
MKPSSMMLVLGVVVVVGIVAITALSLWFQYDREIDDAQRSMDGLSRALAIQTEREIKSADRTLVDFLLQKNSAAARGVKLPLSATAFGAANPTIVSLAYVSVDDAADQDVTAEAAARRAFAEAGGDPVLVPRSDGLISVVRRDIDPNSVVRGAVVAVIDPGWLADFNRAMNFSGETVVTLTDDYGVVVARNGTDDGGQRLSSSAAVGEYALTAHISLPRFVLLSNWYRALMLFSTYGAVACAALGTLLFMFARQWARRERAEAAAFLTEGRFRDFAQAASDWLWETDAEHRFVYISERFTDWTGAKVSDYLGRNRLETAASDKADKDAICRHMQDFAEHKPFRDFVYPISAPTGIRYLRVSGRPRFDAKGDFAGYRGTASDVTDIVQAENRLHDAKNEAEIASRSKSEFLANMSHELRTPLNAVIGFSEIIRDQLFGKIPPRYIDYARDINMSGKHLLDLINDVLDMSKIEAGRYELNEENVCLGDIARICDTLMATRIAEGGVQVSYAAELAATVIYADARAVKQIFLNLQSNAVKFTPSGGTVTVGVERTEQGDVALLVTDTGCGMGEEALRHLAEPFYQADSSISRKYGGSGLGLAICKKLITLHGGTLEFASRVGGGTSVRATFPRERVLSAPGNQNPSQLTAA